MISYSSSYWSKFTNDELVLIFQPIGFDLSAGSGTKRLGIIIEDCKECVKCHDV